MTSRYALRLPVVPSQYSNVVLNCVRMEIVMREVYVIGHKNPDTDSVCSAICYSRLKNLITGILQAYILKAYPALKTAM